MLWSTSTGRPCGCATSLEKLPPRYCNTLTGVPFSQWHRLAWERSYGYVYKLAPLVLVHLCKGGPLVSEDAHKSVP